MKKLAIFLVVISVSVVGISAMLTDAQRAVLENLVRCTKRDTSTMPGHVIAHWTKGGKPYRVTTNAVRQVTSVVQTNPLHADAEVIREIRKKAKKASKNLEKVLKVLSQVLEKAASNDEAALYRALIELLLVGEEE